MRWWWVLVLGAVAALSPVALMYLLVNLYAAGGLRVVRRGS